MAANKGRTSSFSRNVSTIPKSQVPGLRRGLNGTTFLSSGIADLDKILGGGFSLGSLVMIMEDAEAPHHMLLLRNFMSQGLVHRQPLLFVSPAKEPRGFLGTLPSPVSKDGKSREHETEQEKNLRIAWQYKKYFGEQNLESQKDPLPKASALFGREVCSSVNRTKPSHYLAIDNLIQAKKNKISYSPLDRIRTLDHLPLLDYEKAAEYCNDFNLRKPLDRQMLSGQSISCVSLQNSPDLDILDDQCSKFLAQVPRHDGEITSASRISIQSFCAPQCSFSEKEWDVLNFIRSLKSLLRYSNAVAVVTFPPSLVSPTVLKRLQHLADTLLSVKAVPDEDKELAKLLTGYQDMLGLLNVHKVARLNTQIPLILEATTYSMKLYRRRSLVLECLNQAPVDGSSGSSYGTSGSCSTSAKTGSLDF